MKNRFAMIVAASALVLGVSVASADAACTTTGTVVGAGTGGVLGAVVTHGSPVGIVGGAVVGGLAGHTIAQNNCERHYRHGYYDRHHRWHYYASR